MNKTPLEESESAELRWFLTGCAIARPGGILLPLAGVVSFFLPTFYRQLPRVVPAWEHPFQTLTTPL